MEKLNSCQRGILATCGLEADLPMTKMSSLTGHPAHVVRYALNRISELKLAEPIWIIDVYKIGWHRFSFYGSLEASSPDARERFVKRVAACDKVGYFCDIVGDYEYEMSLLARSPGEALETLGQLVCKANLSFFRKALAARTKICSFPRKYLSPKSARLKRIEYGDTVERVVIDELDSAILNAVSRSPDLSMPMLAKQLGKPRSTVERRFSELMARKILLGKVFSTKPATYGALAMKLLIASRGFETSTTERILAFAEEDPYCTYVHVCFGDWDFEIGAEVPDYAHLVELRSKLSKEFGKTLLDIHALARSNVYKHQSYPIVGARLPGRPLP